MTSKSPLLFNKMEKTYDIKCLDMDMIAPRTGAKGETGSKIAMIGKPGVGKSSVIRAMLHAKRHIFPVGEFQSGTEDSNHFYENFVPPSFIYNEYDADAIEKFVKRQKFAKKYLENPWSVLLLDDCADDTTIFNKPLQQGLFKLGRHWKMLYILSLQYALDVNRAVRTNLDGVFIFRDPILKNRKTIWENYASVVPDFKLFCELMDQLTDDYCCMYVHNQGQTNDWTECVFWYKAPEKIEGFKFGCEDYWKFDKERFDPNYVDNYGI